LGHDPQAADMLNVGVSTAVSRTGRSRAHFELMAQLFQPGFTAAKSEVPEQYIRFLANQADAAAFALGKLDDSKAASRLYFQVTLAERPGFSKLLISLCNLALSEQSLGRVAAGKRLLDLAEFASELGDDQIKAHYAYMLSRINIDCGNIDWQQYAPLAAFDDPEAFKGPVYVKPWLIYKKIELDGLAGTLTEAAVSAALAQEDIKANISLYHYILAEYARMLQQQDEYTRARDIFIEAIRMGREQDSPVDVLEAQYAVTLARLGEIETAREIAERLSRLREPPHLRLAELWLALGETEKARAEALLAYPKAWADGPPYAFHWDLKNCRAVLTSVGEPEPQLPTVRPEDLPPFEFEAKVLEWIEEEKAKQREAEAKAARDNAETTADELQPEPTEQSAPPPDKP